MPEYESVLIIRVDFGQMAHDKGRTEGQIAFWSNLNLSSAIYGFQFHKEVILAILQPLPAMSQVQDCPDIAIKSVNQRMASMFDCPRKTWRKMETGWCLVGELSRLGWKEMPRPRMCVKGSCKTS